MQHKNILHSFDFSQYDLADNYEKLLDNQGLRTKEHDMIVFSHLRWNLVFQRPQHLLSRFALDRRVFYFEEPIFIEQQYSSWRISYGENGVKIVTPILPKYLDQVEIVSHMKLIVDNVILDEGIENYITWYYTPMALAYSQHLVPSAIIYDCIDELSAFKAAPKEMIHYENRLLKIANVVFAAGNSLYEVKKKKHHNIYPFPNSIDYEHFKKARTPFVFEPEDQKNIPHPRVGFFGVIDERVDLKLLEEMATMKPDWHFVMIGPVVNVHQSRLPKNKNVHFLGKKEYKELPYYMSSWDMALMPFALNDSTKFLNPTKTLEFLAAGLPVVSTPIRDVVRPFAEHNLVRVSSSAKELLAQIQQCLMMNSKDWLKRVDEFLLDISWDSTFKRMAEIVRSSYKSQYDSRALIFSHEEENQNFQS